jgi:hypothetical protein
MFWCNPIYTGASMFVAKKGKVNLEENRVYKLSKGFANNGRRWPWTFYC